MGGIRFMVLESSTVVGVCQFDRTDAESPTATRQKGDCARVKKEPENQCGARFWAFRRRPKGYGGHSEVAEGHTILSRAGGPD